MKPRLNSLVVRLSWQLILLQLVALTLVALIVAVPEAERRYLNKLDGDVLETIAAALVIEDGKLITRVSAENMAVIANYPNFWFLAGDAQGRKASYGPVPSGIQTLFENIGSVVNVEIYRDSEADADANVLALRLDSPVGRVTVMTGGGPTLNPIITRLQRISPVYLLLLITLTTVSALAVPFLLRRDLSGVARVADEAAHIDIDKPGTRLTAENVPPELQGMVGAMNAALSRLDDALEKRKRFLATAAHELRTPVAILSMRIELLPPGLTRSQLMLDAARLASLAHQLLDLQRLDGDETPLVRLNLCALIAEAVTDIAPLAVASGAGLSFDAPEGSVEVLGDRHAILRVATNLIQNALAHGGPGVAVSVEVALPAELRVRDNGPGIAANDRIQIFEPFVRRSSAPGSGLGLHLVQDIVTRHRSTIQANEAPGGGAEFVVRFPPLKP